MSADEPNVRAVHDVEPGSRPASPRALERARRINAQLLAAQRAATELTGARRDAIREALDEGHTQADIARALDVSRARVWQILNDWDSGR